MEEAVGDATLAATSAIVDLQYDQFGQERMAFDWREFTGEPGFDGGWIVCLPLLLELGATPPWLCSD